MQSTVENETFERIPASYFYEKADKAKGKYKLLVALEMNKYISSALQHGISFEELKQLGFKFATV